MFTVLHAPEPGGAGHVHLLELDQFVGRRHLVTVHGPLNPDVPLERAQDTGSVLARIEAGRFRPVRRSSCPTRSSPPWRDGNALW